MQEKQFILTTEQLAQAYGVNPKVISNNFNRHMEDFTEGIHYFVSNLEEDKMSFSNNDILSERTSNNDILSERTSNNDILSERTSNRGGARRKYLWTLKGAFTHAWIVKSPKARVAYEKFIELSEKPQVTTGVSPEAFTLLEEKYKSMTQLAADAMQIKANKTALTEENVADVLRMMVKFQRYYSDLIQGEKNPQSIHQAVLRELKQFNANWKQTHTFLEECYYETMNAHVQQANLKSLISSTIEELKALTAPILPMIEAPR
jgi:hypothetical protein